MEEFYSMATGQGNDGNRFAETSEKPGDEDFESGGRLSAIPELARRALSLGLSGFFLTEETIRKALGDSLPKDWTDFASEQSERTRKEFVERLSFEMARTLENVDFPAALGELLEGRTLKIKAEISLSPKRGEGRPGKARVAASGRVAKR
jgi:hypothetical protein